MAPRRGVVVGYDGSPSSRAAVEWAVTEAGRRAATLTVLHAAEFTDLTPWPVAPLAWAPLAVKDVQRRLTDEGVNLARRICSAPGPADVHLRPEARFRSEQVVGLVSDLGPAAALVDASAWAELVVTGSRGHGQVVGDLVGSVAFQVAAHSRCPVVVVRGGSAGPPGPNRGIAVGVDGSPGSEQATDVACEMAAAAKAPVQLVHAWQVPWQGTWAGQTGLGGRDLPTPAESAKEIGATVLGDACRRAQQRHGDVQVTTLLESGPAWRVLADLSRTFGLVVVGARVRGGFTSLLLGSVSRDLLSHARCPVLIVRHTARSADGSGDR